MTLVHVFSKTSKPLKKQFLFPLVGLFLFGFLLLNISSYHAQQLLSSKKKVNQTVPLNYAQISDTIQISMNPSIKDEDYDNININGIGGLIDFITEFDDKFVPVEIEIYESANDSFQVVKEYSASGKNDKDAIQNATSFKHSISQVRNRVVIDPYIEFNDEQVKFRNQKIRIKVYVPEGKVIRWDRRTERYIDLGKVDINFDAGANLQTLTPPTPPTPPSPPSVPGNPNKVSNHKIEIHTSSKGNNDSGSSKVIINIDSDDKNLNEALSKAQNKIDEAMERLEELEPNVDVNVDIEGDDNDDYYSREHYIFRMVNGELIPLD